MLQAKKKQVCTTVAPFCSIPQEKVASCGGHDGPGKPRKIFQLCPTRKTPVITSQWISDYSHQEPMDLDEQMSDHSSKQVQLE